MKILHQAKTGTNDLIILGKKKKVEYEYIGKHMGEEKKNKVNIQNLQFVVKY